MSIYYKETVSGTTHATPCGGMSAEVDVGYDMGSALNNSPAYYHHRVVRAGGWRFDAEILCWVNDCPTANVALSFSPKFRLSSAAQAYALQRLQGGMELAMYEPDLEEALVTLEEVREQFVADGRGPYVPLEELLTCFEAYGASPTQFSLEEDTALGEGQYIIAWLSKVLAEDYAKRFPRQGLLTYISEEHLARGLSAFLGSAVNATSDSDPQARLYAAGNIALEHLVRHLNKDGLLSAGAA